MGRVLIVDDDERMCEMLALGLRRKGRTVAYQTSAAAALELLATEEQDVVVTDLNMPGLSGIELCKAIVENRPDVPVIVITAFGQLDTAVAAIRAGAYDFITKPLEVEALALAVERALRHRALHQEVKRLRETVEAARGDGELIGESPPMQRLFALIESIVDSDASVLITGESGTGKDVIARLLHRRGPRRERDFVAINCSAMPEALLESELFGHARGAFTGAQSAKLGLFVRADGGTLFLDEIGEMPIGMQAKLLRALQERVVRPVGGEKEIPFDARIIASTNRDLETAIAEQRFRQDLLFRINVVGVEVPPLRARGGDILVLAQHFVRRFAAKSKRSVSGISPAAAERLLAYEWVGNVRELQNCIERAVLLTRHDQILVEDLPERIREYKKTHFLVVADAPEELVPMDEVERRYIARVMAAVGNNKTQAARILGFDRKTLYAKLAKHRLDET